MVALLPTELVIHVMCLAAESWRFTDRQTVVHLAMTSAASYQLISPILYHTIILTDSSETAFIAFVGTEENVALAKRVCCLVRVLHDFRTEFTTELPTRLFTSIESLSGLGNLVRSIAEENKCCPLRQVWLRSADFGLICSKWLPAHAQASVTHLTGYLPIFCSDSPWDDFMTEPKRWIGSILRSLPGLTHLALILIAVQVTGQAWADFRDFDLVALKKALREALAYSDMRCLVLRVCGLHAEKRWDEIQAVVREIDDPRLKVWHDVRPLLSWEYHTTWAVEDAMNGKDVWSEAKSVARPPGTS